MLADDRDGEGMPVLDEHGSGPVEQHAARRAQRQRALVVVLGQLLIPLVLDHLEEPEAHAQDHEHDNRRQLQRLQAEGDATAILGYRHAGRDEFSQAHQLGPPRQTPALHRAGQALDHGERHHAHHGVAQRLPGDGGQRRRERADAEHLIQPHEEARVHGGGRQEDHEPRHGGGDDELLTDGAREKAHDRLRQAADANHAARQRILESALPRSRRAGPPTGPMVSATYTTATSTRSTAAVPPTTKRSRVVCSASASATATSDPGNPHSRASSRRRPRRRRTPAGQHHEHRLERRQLDGGLSRPRWSPRLRAEPILSDQSRSPWDKSRRYLRSRRGPQP